MRKLNTKQRQLGLAITAASFAMCTGSAVSAQEQEPPVASPIVAPVIEEMIVSGRLKSGAQSVVEQRLEQAFSADILGADQIARAGDSDVAMALLRVPGVTVKEGQYVYVRGLGERYASVQLNGAAVPSPELTRNVLPLDIIPSSIVENLKVQKSYSPDLPAHFGGGNVDIKTKSIPEEFLFEMAIGTGMNSESSDDGLSYRSGGAVDGLPAAIDNALDTYQGRLNINNIADIIDTDGGSPSPEQILQARQINRDLILSLNRNIEIKEKSNPIDISGALALGNSWDIGDDWRFGAVVNASHDQEVRNKNQFRQGIGNPEEIYSQTDRTIEETRELLSFNMGLNFQENHNLELNAYKIDITEDEAQIQAGYDANNPASENRQLVDYITRYEERELEVYQALGEHKFDQLAGNTLGTINVDWFYSDSSVETNIPGKATVKGSNQLDPDTGDVINTQLFVSATTAAFEFLNLQDDVESYGGNIDIPFFFDNTEITLSAGYSYNDKAREYFGYTANIGTNGVPAATLNNTPGNVFTDTSINNPDNRFELTMGTGLGTESYIAAQMTDAAYGMFDLKWNETWRLTGGARHEEFRQALLPLDLLDYTGQYIVDLIDAIQEEDQRYAIRDDGWYPSLALTYMNQGFMGTEDFQVRASFAQTLVRPDLREVSEVYYIDPDLDVQVKGNPLLVSSEIDHFEVRTEWFYDNGDNFTVTLFYKDIADPIEQSREPGSDDNIQLTFYNAEAGEIYGAEFEGLKDIGAGFFISGNVTLSDSEIESSADVGYTNPIRQMTGQSDYVANMQLGYDSDNGMHSVSLVYNVFGERIYYAARQDGHDDAYEKPFNSLDIVYSFYPTESLTAKLKVGNILDETRAFEQVNSQGQNVTILEQDVGTSFSLDLRYSF